MNLLNSGVTNISNVPPFKASEDYRKFDIVYFTGNPDPETISSQMPTFEQSGHYYCLSDHTSDSSTSNAASCPTGSSTKWTQDFYFEPSYGTSVTYKNSSYNITMGDGYYSPVNKGINSLKVEFDMLFEGRSDLETKALVHILEDSFNKYNKPSGGYSGIMWNPPSPYNSLREYYVENIQHNFVYPDVNNVSFSFMNETTSTTEWKGFLIPFTGTSGFYKNNRDYTINSIVYFSGGLVDQSGWYYYSGTGGISNHLSSPSGVNSQWSRDNFYFETQQNLTISQTPRVIKRDYQNQYLVRFKDGINKDLLDFSLEFKGLTDMESKAMVHFLESKQGSKQFIYTPPAPYNKQKVFISPEWNHKLIFKDNNNVTVRFVEHPIDYTNKSNTFLTLATTFFDTNFIREGNI